jgi:DNA-binding response OmpR family regulator
MQRHVLIVDDEPYVLRGRELGAVGYIKKPSSTAEVIERVRAFLGPEV